MKIRHIKLNNFKRHKELEVDIKPGLIGLIGANGSGKSSFLSSMAFAITGSALNDDTREKMLTWGEKNGSVEMVFEQNGVDYTIIRQLGKMSATLEGGELSIKGVNPVNVEMQRMAGVPFDLFKGIMFVAQASLDAPLRGTDSARKEAFGKLFNCQRFDKYRDVLQESAARLSMRCGGPDEASIEVLKQKVIDAQKELEKVNNDIVALKEEMSKFNLPELYAVMNSVAMDTAAVENANRNLAAIEERLKAFTVDESKWDPVKNAKDTAWCDSMIRFVDSGKCPMCGRESDKPPISKEEALKRKEALIREKNYFEELLRLRKAKVEWEGLLQRLSTATHTQEEITSASNKIKQHTQLELELRELLSKRGWYEGSLNDLNRSIKDAMEKAKETEKARQQLKTIEAVRSAFHRDCVQKAIRTCGARQINDRLSSYLAVFNLPYMPSFDDDGLLRFKDNKGLIHEFSDLSGGQGNLVALAYRLALMQMFAGNVRVAILDEPTYGVDRQNLEAMCESFRALAEYAGQRGLSVFVATHEEALFPSFDQVVEL